MLLGTVSTVIVTGAIILDLPADSDIFGIKHAVWLCQCATVAVAVAAVRNVIVLSTLEGIASMVAGMYIVQAYSQSVTGFISIRDLGDHGPPLIVILCL